MPSGKQRSFCKQDCPADEQCAKVTKEFPSGPIEQSCECTAPDCSEDAEPIDETDIIVESKQPRKIEAGVKQAAEESEERAMRSISATEKKPVSR